MPDLSEAAVAIATTASDSVGQHAAGRRPRVERVDVPPLPRSGDLYLFHRGLQYPSGDQVRPRCFEFPYFCAAASKRASVRCPQELITGFVTA